MSCIWAGSWCMPRTIIIYWKGLRYSPVRGAGLSNEAVSLVSLCMRLNHRWCADHIHNLHLEVTYEDGCKLHVHVLTSFADNRVKPWINNMDKKINQSTIKHKLRVCVFGNHSLSSDLLWSLESGLSIPWHYDATKARWTIKLKLCCESSPSASLCNKMSLWHSLSPRPQQFLAGPQRPRDSANERRVSGDQSEASRLYVSGSNETRMTAVTFYFWQMLLFITDEFLLKSTQLKSINKRKKMAV